MPTANLYQMFNTHEAALAAKSGDLCSSTETDNQLWERLFSIENLKRVFWDIQLQIIRKKCLAGTYQFTPYLEELVLKGKATAPRVLSIPTIRDKLVLSIMKDFMHVIFSEYISRDLPNTVIYRIKRALGEKPSANFIRLDIKGFYENIQHAQLLNKCREATLFKCLYHYLTELSKYHNLSRTFMPFLAKFGYYRSAAFCFFVFSIIVGSKVFLSATWDAKASIVSVLCFLLSVIYLLRSRQFLSYQAPSIYAAFVGPVITEMLHNNERPKSE
jgi:hypothetical protein